MACGKCESTPRVACAGDLRTRKSSRHESSSVPGRCKIALRAACEFDNEEFVEIEAVLHGPERSTCCCCRSRNGSANRVGGCCLGADATDCIHFPRHSAAVRSVRGLAPGRLASGDLSLITASG